MNAETTVCFNRRERERTCWLELEFPVGEEPAELIAELNAIGFASDGLASAPPLDGIETVCLSKRGSALFAGWTPEEEQENLAAARQVLARHGFEDVPVNELTYADLA